MTIEIRDVFICTSRNQKHKDFKVFGSYAVESVAGNKVKFEGIERAGSLVKEHDYYVFSNREIEATFERPQPPF